MTTLLLVRHGESVANLEDRFAGHWDAALTPRGHAQAEKTAEYIAEHYRIDAIYNSSLRRARETAQHLADRLGMPLRPHDGIREIYAGAWEGEKFEKIEADYPEDFFTWINDVGNACCTNGETVAALADRVSAALTEIAAANDGKTLAVVTHATPIRVMQCRWQGFPLAAMQEIPWVSNASVTCAVFENGVFTLQSVGADSHLAEMRTALPANV